MAFGPLSIVINAEFYKANKKNSIGIWHLAIHSLRCHYFFKGKYKYILKNPKTLSKIHIICIVSTFLKVHIGPVWQLYSSSCEWSIVKRNEQLVAKRKLPKHTNQAGTGLEGAPIRSSQQFFPFFALDTFKESLTVLFNRGLQGVMKKGVAGGLIGWSDIQMFMRPSTQPFLLSGCTTYATQQRRPAKVIPTYLLVVRFLVFAMNLSQQDTRGGCICVNKL